MKKYVICMITFMMLGGMASAAANDSDLMKAGMGRAWLEQQGAEVQELLNFVLGALVVVTIVAYAIFTGKAGIGIMAHSTTMGDPRERSHAQNALLQVLYALVAIVLLIKIGTRFFGWY
jgi:uncharacterized membrane protein YjgN (DUF898 family)